ncbi:S8 family serine peptidase [Infirmifilum sp.]|uniref:S8 family serine peptidase n=1 Tax=Infirmifilum sp. TaxID=2856575 RepID=UPI003D13BE2E
MSLKDAVRAELKRIGILWLIVLVIAGSMVVLTAPAGAPNPPSAPNDISVPRFVGNFTLGGEKVVASTVVFKVGTPASVAEKAYSEILSKYTIQRAVQLDNGRSVTLREIRVSKLVKDASGRYMFRVAEAPHVLSRLLAPYEQYIDRVVYKPVPRTMEIEPLDGKLPNPPAPAPTNVIIRDLIGVSRAQSVYGVTGKGVDIAIVDTGVDYGHPDLTTALKYWSGTYKGESIREPLVMDADESQVLILQEVTLVNSTHVYVGGRMYTTLTPWPVEIYPPYDYYRIPSYVYTQVTQGAKLRFGLTYMFGWYGTKIVGVLLYNPPVHGFYSYAIVDVNGNGNFADEIAPPIDAYARGSALRYSANRVIAPDYDKNGFPDDSLGVAGGFFYDWWWYFSYPAEIHAGWDKQGRWLSIFYDFDGHGTSCASAAAGRGVVTYNITNLGAVKLTGMAPGASVIGVKALWIGNSEVGMLWAAGFDVDPYTGKFYYTGSRRATLISNSWGISCFTCDYGAFGYDYESVFVAGLSLPGFLDPRYPGILIVQAAGNGGPGYGTVTSPGASPGVLTVGASTSTHFAYAENIFESGAGWSSDEIISWSARGPTIIGYTKPDVVNVGAFGFTVAPVRQNYTIFGGTSYATPLTAGVAALVYEVLGTSADPALVKNIIASTANYLRYDPASEGSGRVNAFGAVSLARLLSKKTAAEYKLQVYGSSLWQAYSAAASSIWGWQWCDNIAAMMLQWAGTELPVPSCALPDTASRRIDLTAFFGTVAQGGSSSVTLTVRNPTNKTVTVTVYPTMLTLKNQKILNTSLSLSPNAPNNRTRWVFTSENLTSTLRFMEVVATIPYSVFDPNNNYQADVRVRVWIHLWKADKNSNGIPDPDETILVNYGYGWSNWNLATMSYPTGKLGTNKGIVVTVELVRGFAPSGAYVPPVPITVTINYVDVVYGAPTWVSVSPSSATLAPGASQTFNLTVKVPSNAAPTTYTGYLLVANNATGPIAVPYSFNVYASVGTAAVELTAGVNGRWPPVNVIRGATNWAWRFESGDWRWFYVKPSASNALALEYAVQWSLPDTSLIGFAVGPDGQFAGGYFGQGASWFKYLGGGTFAWMGTGAGSIQNAKRFVMFPAIDYRYWLYPHKKPEDGIFTLIVRTALFDASQGASEGFSALVRVLPAAQKLPSSAIDGGSFPMRFSLPYIVQRIYASTGRSWTPLLDYDQEYTPGSYYVSPSSVLGPYPSNTQFTFNVYVWNNGAPGQKFDVSALYSISLPSLPVYYRYANSYYKLTDYYTFEDWIRVIKQ